MKSLADTLDNKIFVSSVNVNRPAIQIVDSERPTCRIGFGVIVATKLEYLPSPKYKLTMIKQKRTLISLLVFVPLSGTDRFYMVGYEPTI